MDRQKVNEARYFNALKEIANYMSVEQLRRRSESKYGLSTEEAIEMAYENVLETAKAAIRGQRGPNLAPPEGQ